jgi:serpin B
MFRQINSVVGEKNLFISPLSISLCLAMTYNGADGETRSEMQNTLGFPDYSTDEINTYFQKLSTTLVGIDSRVIFDIANSIWYRKGFYVLPEFINVNRTFYNAEVDSLDFNSVDAVPTINNWVAEKTHDKIDKVLESIDPDQVMFLINAIYFKGQWRYEFDKSNTHNEIFHLSSAEQISTPTMHQETTLGYFCNEQMRAVDMPYGQGNFSMMVLLPNEGFQPDDIIRELTPENWTSWTAGLHETDVEISFPRFKFKFDRELNSDLINLGMIKAFSPNEADFTKINPAGNLYIGFVKHFTFVEVNEQGTEAAAVTVTGMETTSAGGGATNFVVDRPFVFVIRETTTNTIIFIGKMVNPAIE